MVYIPSIPREKPGHDLQLECIFLSIKTINITPNTYVQELSPDTGLDLSKCDSAPNYSCHEKNVKPAARGANRLGYIILLFFLTQSRTDPIKFGSKNLNPYPTLRVIGRPDPIYVK
jgi:hypothetical protein